MIDNYLENIKNEIINGNAKVAAKNYQINNVKITMNYNIGKELAEAGKHYGEGIVKKYASILTKEFGSGYSVSILKRMRQFYVLFEKGAALPHQLTWEHLRLLLPLKDINKVNYYIDISIRDNLSYRKLAERIKGIYKNAERIEITTVTPTVGCHIGNGVLSIGYLITDSLKEKI